MQLANSIGQEVIQSFQHFKSQNASYYSMLIISGEDVTLCLKVIILLGIRLVYLLCSSTMACSRCYGTLQKYRSAADVHDPVA